MDRVLKDQIRNLISRGRSDNALDLFIQWANSNGSDLGNDLIGLKAQLSSLKRNENLGLSSFSEAELRRNQINYGIIHILESAEENTERDNILQMKTQAKKAKLPQVLFLTSKVLKHEGILKKTNVSSIFYQLDNKYRIYSALVNTSDDFAEAILKREPVVLHFEERPFNNTSSFGRNNKLENFLTNINLEDTFNRLKNNKWIPKIIILDGCYSIQQAEMMSVYTDYLIGLDGEWEDDDVIPFFQSFYKAYSENDDVEQVFKSARLVFFQLKKVKAIGLPVLYKKGQLQNLTIEEAVEFALHGYIYQATCGISDHYYKDVAVLRTRFNQTRSNDLVEITSEVLDLIAPFNERISQLLDNNRLDLAILDLQNWQNRFSNKQFAKRLDQLLSELQTQKLDRLLDDKDPQNIIRRENLKNEITTVFNNIKAWRNRQYPPPSVSTDQYAPFSSAVTIEDIGAKTFEEFGATTSLATPPSASREFGHIEDGVPDTTTAIVFNQFIVTKSRPRPTNLPSSLRTRASDILAENVFDDRLSELKVAAFVRLFVNDTYGEGHLLLACYAAFPTQLNYDLVYQIWLNCRDRNNIARPIDWIAVSDFLLSSLVSETSTGVFEIPMPIRKALLYTLGRRFEGEKILSFMAEFMLIYLKNRELEGFAANDTENEIQRWNALSYLDYDATIAQIRQALNEAAREGYILETGQNPRKNVS